ncbi:MAG: YbgC/FadM family acyl-CoA thioesterase [Aquabacterium sp.]|nr:YbgC/FadM family acyl-CoA thioesterase [Aquabacterium sp.]
MTALQDFSFKHRIKVRWVEVDPQQVVFNGHYLTYFDTAMSEYWRAVGQPYPEGFNFFGGEVFIRRNTIEYHAPGKLDDWLDIGIRCDRVGNSSITMAWSVWTQGRLLVTGESVYVFTTLNTAKPVAVPPGLRQQIELQARGQDVFEIIQGDWADLQTDAATVRRAVFVKEQGIDESEEWDDDDARSHHVVLRSKAGLVIGTGRLIPPAGEAAPNSDHIGKIGRMAVIKSCRSTGVGKRLLTALLDEAKRRQMTHIRISAQVAAKALYERAGFVDEGDVYDEVGIPHQAMVKRL